MGMIKEEEATHEFNKKELELENQTREAMSTNEIEMREFLAEELRLERESEANTNYDMIEEEEYLRKTFEELDIMEENERKLMAYDEWQQIEGRRILRNAMKKELLRESKREICRRKAWKMYMWSLFVIKANQLYRKRRKLIIAKIARRASMRTAILREARRLKEERFKASLHKKYFRRKVLFSMMDKAKEMKL